MRRQELTSKLQVYFVTLHFTVLLQFVAYLTALLSIAISLLNFMVVHTRIKRGNDILLVFFKIIIAIMHA